MNNVKQAKKINKFLLIGILILCVFCFLTGVFFIRLFFDNSGNSISYTEKSAVNYQVCLKENNYFDDKCLIAGKNYVSDIIDYIDINFSDSINSSVLLNQKYSYSVTSKIIATNKEDSSKVVYDKSGVLTPEKTFDNKANIADINQNIRIKYSDYSKLITDFKKDYVLALDAKLVITLDANYTGFYANTFSSIDKNDKLIIEIPLSEQTISITTSGMKNPTTTTVYKKQAQAEMEKKLLIFMIFFDITILAFLLIFFFKLNPNKQEYIRKLNKILKEYDRAIVTTQTMPNIRDKNLVKVDKFEEMLDARENLQKPILLYNSKNQNRSIFTITNIDDIFIYVLGSNTKEK